MAKTRIWLIALNHRLGLAELILVLPPLPLATKVETAQELRSPNLPRPIISMRAEATVRKSRHGGNAPLATFKKVILPSSAKAG
jgi:hypothetical protein